MRNLNKMLHKKRIFAYLFLMFMCCLPATLFASTTEVPLFTYHTHAPFIVASHQGLTYDLAEYLSKKSHGRYQFVVKPMSRTRVNKILKQGEAGIVPWVNPAWFNDVAETKFLWSKSILMQDSNVLLSHIERKIDYRGRESVSGLTFGGVRGHRYQGIDDWVQQKALSRIDTETHISNYRKLMRKRIDFTITPLTGALYLLKQHGLQDQIFISPNHHSTYERRLIVSDKNIEIKAYIEKTLAQMSADPTWGKLLNKYK